MNYGQISRFNKINDNLFLNQFIIFDRKFLFYIEGNTGVYEVKLSKINGNIRCNCPDMFICTFLNNICKHCCYVIFNILSFNYNNKKNQVYFKINGQRLTTNFFTDLVFSQEELQYIEKIISLKFN